jgi:hypothetical protein
LGDGRQVEFVAGAARTAQSAAAPVTFTHPKSATALPRPIVARLPWRQ